MDDNKYKQWIDTLRAKGQSDDDIAKMIAGAVKLSSMELFTLVMATLSEEELQQIETIPNDEQAQQKITELFEKKAGITMQELVGGIRDGLIEKALKENS